MCTSTGEGGETLLKLWGSTIRTITPHTEKLQALDGRQEQRTLVAKILSRISYLDELNP